MAKYRKKPVVIEAMQWDGTVETAVEISRWSSEQVFPTHDGGLEILTLEGNMVASPGDWIIKGVAGEFYPCKPGIFEATYEPVENVE